MGRTVRPDRPPQFVRGPTFEIAGKFFVVSLAHASKRGRAMSDRKLSFSEHMAQAKDNAANARYRGKQSGQHRSWNWKRHYESQQDWELDQAHRKLLKAESQQAWELDQAR